MFAKERQNKISEMLKTDGAVTVSGLVSLFGVSIETIRKDLVLMEKAGLLTRVHGGAMKMGDFTASSNLASRNKEHGELKRELADTAMRFISEGDIISIGAGSTPVYLAQAIKTRVKKLTVVTYSYEVFDILSESEGIDAILCGGDYLRSEKAFYGSLAEDMLKKLYVNKAFVFPSAISCKYGLCDCQSELVEMQRLMISSADKVFILADSSKFEKKALRKISDMNTDYTYITDGKLPQKLFDLYRENGFTVMNS